MTRTRRVMALAAVAAMTGSCTDPQSQVQGRAKFFSGATPAAAGITAGPVTDAAAVVPQNGTWKLSPDKVTMTLTGISMRTADGPGSNGAAGECTVTYEKSKPGLTQLADCAFTTEPGEFSGLNLEFNGTVQILVNDATHGFYSTPTGIVTTAPAGGAQPWTFPIPGAGGGSFQPSPIVFPKPLVVTDSGTLTLSIVLGALQFFDVTVANGAVTIPSGSPNVPGMIAAVGAVAKTEFYSRQGIGTADSYCAYFCAGTSPTGITSVALYYADATTPVIGAMGNNGIGSNCPTGGFSTIGAVKSYMGLDASGNVSWAMGTDLSYTAYAAELQMARVSTIGGTTTLYCKGISADPAPAGGSFASGAPGIAQAANVVGLFTLVGK
jgi:hypothetical protein